MTRPFLLGIVSLMLLFGSGCSPYVSGYLFLPRPAMAEVHSATTQSAPAPVTALASVVGIRYADQKEGLPTSVEVRLRIEATGAETVAFDPHTLQLTTGTLLKFPPPRLDPANPVTLASTQSADVAAFFPFPAGRSYDNTDLATLQLRWIVQINGQPVQQVANFSRVIPYDYYYPEPYWGYPTYYGFGYYNYRRW